LIAIEPGILIIGRERGDKENVTADLPGILALMRDFAAYEDLSEYCTANEERLGSAMFGKNAYVEGLVASDQEALIGYALFYPCFCQLSVRTRALP
jgi:hypothetical protein